MTYSIIKKLRVEESYRLDAEYYQPEYLGIENSIRNTNNFKFWSEINGKFITGPFGSEFNVENYTKDRTYRYVRGKDVKKFFLEDNDNVYISKNDFDRLIKYSLKNCDILISVVGTLGNTTVIDKTILPGIFSCKSTVFRSNFIDPYYLIAYLNSKYGQKQLKRSARGAVQTGLNIDDLKSLLIFIPTKNTQKAVSNIVRQAKQKFELSKKLYQKAENMLLEELKLKDFDAEKRLSYTTKLSKVKSTHRMDAEYFQPKYERLIENIKREKIQSLPDVIKNIPAKFNPALKPRKKFRYVELANIESSIGVIDGYSRVSGGEAPSRAKRLLKKGDVIISSVQGSLEKVALVNKEQEDYLASTGFFQFRSQKILPEVFLVLAKSIILQMQLEKQCAGTILTAVPKDAINKIFIPILPKATQQKIANLVRKSHASRQKAKDLLEKAKNRVEELIENRE